MPLQLGPDYIHPSSELLGLTFQDITHPEDLETDLAQVRLLLGGEIPSYAMEKRYLHRGSAPPLPSTCSGRRDGRQAWCG